MDLFKAITGKNPADFQPAARKLVDEPDVELYKKLVNQDDFLFDFVKANVANRIKKACNNSNYKNLLKFFNYYSPSYDTVIAEVLWQYGKMGVFEEVINFFTNGSDDAKSYAVKFLGNVSNDKLIPFISKIRKYAYSEYEPLSVNSIELLSKIGDEEFLQTELGRLNSSDEFEQYDAVKRLVTYGYRDSINKIIEIMKKSTLSENIACEIPFLVSPEDLLNVCFEDGILVLCNIVNAIPEIAPLSTIFEYNLLEIFESMYYDNLVSSSAILLRLAKDKFSSLSENDEYLFDVDKKTKDEIKAINNFFMSINTSKLNSLLYEELYDESDFVMFAVDFANGVEELETLLDTKNQTLLLKVLAKLKENNQISDKHKKLALENIKDDNLRQIVEVL